jgi:hypothetical protein
MFPGVKAAGVYGSQPYHLHVLIVLKSGFLNLLEHSGPVQACNGIALPLSLPYFWCLKLCGGAYIPEKFVHPSINGLIHLS